MCPGELTFLLIPPSCTFCRSILYIILITFPTQSFSLDGELETVVVSAVLDMEYSNYLTDGDSVQKQLREALAGLGLEVVDIRAESYGLKQ